eukprot:252026_1
MATKTTMNRALEILKEGWLERQNKEQTAIWTRQWIVTTPIALYICNNYKSYKDVNQVIHAADIQSVESSDIGCDGQNLLLIKTNKETICFKCLGFAELNNWKFDIEICMSCIKIPIFVECKTSQEYNCNFELIAPYHGCYALDKIIKNIITYLETKYSPIKFTTKTINSNSYCGKTIDFASFDWTHWESRDTVTPITFPKDKIIQMGIHLDVDIRDIQYEKTKTEIKKPPEKRIKPNNNENKEKWRNWLIENKHNEILWDKLRSFDRRKRLAMQKLILCKNDSNTSLQSKYINENENRINELLQNVRSNTNGSRTYLCEKLLKILHNCALIHNNQIHEQILMVIIQLTIGSGLMSINYTLSHLPFMSPLMDIYIKNIDEREQIYYKTMKIWWDEARLSINHCATFQPTNIETVAIEFAQYLNKRLSENGNCLEYALVAHMQMDKKYNIWNRNEHLSFSLPNKSSKCLGGKELFQRLYLDAYVDGKFGFGDSFVVDLKYIDESRGDNWCFDGNGNVLMANNTLKNVCNLKVGDKVRSFPNCVSTVICCITSNIDARIEMVELKNNCWITFEHPVLINNCEYNGTYDGLNGLNTDEIKQYGLLWVLPKVIRLPQLRYQDKIYNFLLDSHHTINVNGNWCCTLGHDYTGEVIYHPFWGNSNVVKSFLKSKSNTYPNVVF